MASEKNVSIWKWNERKRYVFSKDSTRTIRYLHSYDSARWPDYTANSWNFSAKWSHKLPEIMSGWSELLFAFRIKVTLQSVFAQMIFMPKISRAVSLVRLTNTGRHTQLAMTFETCLHSLAFGLNLLIRFASSNVNFPANYKQANNRSEKSLLFQALWTTHVNKQIDTLFSTCFVWMILESKFFACV